MGWNDIKAGRRAVARHREAREESVGRYDELCHMLLSVGVGRELLEMMYDRTVYRQIGPGASDQELRFLSAQAAFVQDIEAARARGERAAAEKAKAEQAA